MFESLKKSKTLRSLLGATALFMAGAPSVAEAAPKAPQKMTQSTEIGLGNLKDSLLPLLEQTEGNYPYCYYGKTGSITVGCGVHMGDFSSLQNLTVLKVTPKKGCSFSLDQRKRLSKMADANWGIAATKKLFPEVEKVEMIKLKDCAGACPKNTDKKWGAQIFLMPTRTLKRINQEAIDFYVKKAYQYHPNLLRLPPSARLVVVDLMYNLGYGKYREEYPKFQEAVRKLNLTAMKEECGSSNKRRDAIRKYLMDSALLVKARGCRLSGEQLCRLHRAPAVKNKDFLSPACEPVLWKVLDDNTLVNRIWSQKQSAPVKYGKVK